MPFEHQISYIPLIGAAPTVDCSISLSAQRQRRLISARGRLPEELGGRVLASDKARQIRTCFPQSFNKCNRFSGGCVQRMPSAAERQEQMRQRRRRPGTAAASSSSSAVAAASASGAGSVQRPASATATAAVTVAASGGSDGGAKRWLTEAQNWKVPEEHRLYRAVPQGGTKQPAYSFLRASRFHKPRTGGHNAADHKLNYSSLRHDRRAWRAARTHVDHTCQRGAVGAGCGQAISVDELLPDGGDRLARQLGTVRSTQWRIHHATNPVATSFKSRRVRFPSEATRSPGPTTYSGKHLPDHHKVVTWPENAVAAARRTERSAAAAAAAKQYM
jgi:hypothetical protein